MVLVLLLAALASVASAAEPRQLRFVRPDANPVVLSVEKLAATCGAETISLEDPYYGAQKDLPRLSARQGAGARIRCADHRLPGTDRVLPRPRRLRQAGPRGAARRARRLPRVRRRRPRERRRSRLAADRPQAGRPRAVLRRVDRRRAAGHAPLPVALPARPDRDRADRRALPAHRAERCADRVAGAGRLRHLHVAVHRLPRHQRRGRRPSVPI